MLISNNLENVDFRFLIADVMMLVFAKVTEISLKDIVLPFRVGKKEMQ